MAAGQWELDTYIQGACDWCIDPTLSEWSEGFFSLRESVMGGPELAYFRDQALSILAGIVVTLVVNEVRASPLPNRPYVLAFEARNGRVTHFSFHDADMLLKFSEHLPFIIGGLEIMRIKDQNAMPLARKRLSNSTISVDRPDASGSDTMRSSSETLNSLGAPGASLDLLDQQVAPPSPCKTYKTFQPTASKPKPIGNSSNPSSDAADSASGSSPSTLMPASSSSTQRSEGSQSDLMRGCTKIAASMKPAAAGPVAQSSRRADLAALAESLNRPRSRQSAGGLLRKPFTRSCTTLDEKDKKSFVNTDSPGPERSPTQSMSGAAPHAGHPAALSRTKARGFSIAGVNIEVPTSSLQSAVSSPHSAAPHSESSAHWKPNFTPHDGVRRSSNSPSVTDDSAAETADKRRGSVGPKAARGAQAATGEEKSKSAAHASVSPPLTSPESTSGAATLPPEIDPSAPASTAARDSTAKETASNSGEKPVKKKKGRTIKTLLRSGSSSSLAAPDELSANHSAIPVSPLVVPVDAQRTGFSIPKAALFNTDEVSIHLSESKRILILSGRNKAVVEEEILPYLDASCIGGCIYNTTATFSQVAEAFTQRNWSLTSCNIAADDEDMIRCTFAMRWGEKILERIKQLDDNNSKKELLECLHVLRLSLDLKVMDN
eukprot:scpid55103/ scgid31571/ 